MLEIIARAAAGRLAFNTISDTIGLNEIDEMSSHAWPLSTTVSYLERLLDAVGEGREVDSACERQDSRESLRERFRRAVRLLKRLRVEDEADYAASSTLMASYQSNATLPEWHPSVGPSDTGQQVNVFTRHSPTSSKDLLTGARSELCSSLSTHTGLFGELPAPVPFFSKAVATLDVAIRVGRDGATAVYAAVMALWSRRYDISNSAGAPKQPRRRRSLDRLLLALMRFVFGFFGSHKVDARNNP